MRRRQLAHRGDGERLDCQVRLEQVSDGIVHVEVGAPDPQLRHDPVLRVVARRPDRIVRTRFLAELDGDRDQVAARVAHDEEHERRGEVPRVGVATDGRNVGQYCVVGYVQLAVLYTAAQAYIIIII